VRVEPSLPGIGLECLPRSCSDESSRLSVEVDFCCFRDVVSDGKRKAFSGVSEPIVLLRTSEATDKFVPEYLLVRWVGGVAGRFLVLLAPTLVEEVGFWLEKVPMKLCR
jgi:hypothetical protein